jgi:hypothetical protein
MRGTFDDVEFNGHASPPKGSMHPNRVGEEQITGAGLEVGARETLREVAEERREVGVREIRLPGIHRDRRCQAADKHHIGVFVGLETVARFSQIEFGGEQHQARRQREAFVPCPQYHRCRQVAAGRHSADHDVLSATFLEQPAVGRDAVIEGGRIGMFRRHAVIH